MNNRFGKKNEINMYNIKKINKPLSNRFNFQTNLNNFHKRMKETKFKNKLTKNNINKDNIVQNKNNIILKNINKYNSKTNQLNLIIINNLISGKISRFKSLIKDNNIINNKTEYLKRYYKNKEINELFPKFYQYYKNYFKFFLKPTLSDFYYNDLLKTNGNTLAQIYYEKYKSKQIVKRNKIQKIPLFSKKILLSKLLENNNNQLSFNLSNDNLVNSQNKIFSESSISLLSIINIINNNTSRNKLDKENDYIKKKINLFLDLKKDNKSNNKSQKSTAILTPTNNHYNKIIKDFNIAKPKIKNEGKIINNYFPKNNDNIICLSERCTIEKNNTKNNHIFIRDKIQSQKNNKIYRNSNIIKDLKNKLKEINSKNANNVNNKENIKSYIFKNNINKLFSNMKETSFSQTNHDMYQLTTQMSNRTYNFQTQITKVLKKSPNFKNKMNNNVERINSNNMKFSTSLNRNNISTIKKYYRNDYFSKSLIYYQKLKKEKKTS